MSHIFDALQRSESERSGVKGLASGTATDLLERAERQALVQWEADAIIADVGNGESTDLSSGPQPHTLPLEELAQGTLGVRKTAPIAKDTEVFPPFREMETRLSDANHLVCMTDRESPAAEAFRLLKVRLRHLRKDKPLKRVLITSSVPQEGKSFAAANLACTLGLDSAEKVLLVEGDLRRPVLSRMFGVDAKSGVCEVLRGTSDLTNSICQLAGPQIWFFPAGNAKGNPLEVIQSSKLPSLMERLANWFDWIVIDSPPMLPLADTTAWGRIADGILLVARRDVTEKSKLKKGLEAFGADKLIGALLNSSNNASDKDYYYYRARSSGAETPSSLEG